MNTILLIAAAAAQWLLPPQNDENRLPPRAAMVPCDTEKLALDVKQWERPATDSRWVISLDGKWNFSWRASAAAAEWQDKGTLDVPGCWQTQGVCSPLASDKCEAEGAVGLYSTSFSRPWRWWFRRTVLRFEGAAGSLRVRVNGKDAGAAVDCGNAVEFDVSDFLKVFGANSLEVEVFGGARAGASGWRLSGLSRSVCLLSEHSSAPRDFKVETWTTDDGKVGHFKVLDEKGSLIKERELKNLCVWSPEFPYIYVTPIQHKKGWWIFGGSDYYAATLAFRKAEPAGRGAVAINGKRTLVRCAEMRGMCGPNGLVMTRDDMVRDAKTLKSFNFNAVKLSGGPAAQDWYDLCDREGIMVFGDAPAAAGHPCVIPLKADACAAFADRSLWRDDVRGKWLWRGDGDGDGLFDALRNPRPAAFEAKHAGQCVEVVDFDFKELSAKVANRYAVMDLADISCVWQTFDRTGRVTEKNMLFLGGVMPGEEKSLPVKIKDAAEVDSVLFTFFLDQQCVGWNQFCKPFTPVRTPVGKAIANPGFKLNFWRAPTQADIAWGMPTKCRAWRDATISQKPPAGVRSTLKFAELADGSTLVDWTLVIPPGLPPVPRIGLSFTVPNSAANVEYLGYGPWENYSDSAKAAIFGHYAAAVGFVNGVADPATGALSYPDARLNPDNRAVPGEQGYRTGCRWLKVGGKQISAYNAPFGFNVWPYPQSELEGKSHWREMKEASEFTVNVDVAQMGMNGGRDLGAGTYRLVFSVSEAK